MSQAALSCFTFSCECDFGVLEDEPIFHIARWSNCWLYYWLKALLTTLYILFGHVPRLLCEGDHSFTAWPGTCLLGARQKTKIYDPVSRTHVYWYCGRSTDQHQRIPKGTNVNTKLSILLGTLSASFSRLITRLVNALGSFCRLSRLMLQSRPNHSWKSLDKPPATYQVMILPWQLLLTTRQNSKSTQEKTYRQSRLSHRLASSFGKTFPVVTGHKISHDTRSLIQLFLSFSVTYSIDLLFLYPLFALFGTATSRGSSVILLKGVQTTCLPQSPTHISYCAQTSTILTSWILNSQCFGTGSNMLNDRPSVELTSVFL